MNVAPVQVSLGPNFVWNGQIDFLFQENYT